MRMKQIGMLHDQKVEDKDPQEVTITKEDRFEDNDNDLCDEYNVENIRNEQTHPFLRDWIDGKYDKENEKNGFARKWALGIDDPYKERMDDNSNKEENNNVCYATLNTDLSYNEALNGPDQSKWEIAIQEELDGLQEKEVFSDEICPPETKPLETRFVFTEKQNADTSKRYKARLVVKGVGYTTRSLIMFVCEYVHLIRYTYIY